MSDKSAFAQLVETAKQRTILKSDWLIVSQAEAEFKSAESIHELDNAKSLYLGKNGKLALSFRG